MLKDFIQNDILKSLSLWRYWLYRSFLRTRQNYTKTKLGVFWEPLGMIIISFVLAFVWRRVLSAEISQAEYFAYVFVGNCFWMLISGCVNQMISVVANQRNKIMVVPMTALVAEEIGCLLMKLLLLTPFIFLASILSGHFSVLAIVSYIYAAFLTCVTGFGFAFLFGTFALFIPDIKYVVNTIMRFAFLITPVIWLPGSRLAGHEYILYLNPFYWFLELARSGLVTGHTDIYVVLVCSLLALTTAGLGLLVMVKSNNKIKKVLFD